jgi:hypothetical protein
MTKAPATSRGLTETLCPECSHVKNDNGWAPVGGGIPFAKGVPIGRAWSNPSPRARPRTTLRARRPHRSEGVRHGSPWRRSGHRLCRLHDVGFGRDLTLSPNELVLQLS